MNLSEFDYKLPQELIATSPCKEKDEAKLLVISRKNNLFNDDFFYNLPKYLKPDDILVFNDSKVIPARLEGLSNGVKFEVLLVKKIQEENWECWVCPGRKTKIGGKFVFSENLTGTLISRKDGIFLFKFNLEKTDFTREIEKIGQVPIPPYILKARKRIKSEEFLAKDKKDYQTIFAEQPGSVAAPTAGLHFNKRLMTKLNKKGIQKEKITLHVGLGTFQPITTERIEDFQIHSEYFEISAETAKRLNQAKREGRRIIAVGTTTVRVLESSTKNGEIKPTSGETNIYIYPGYKFKFVDGLITNFHLPKSSLLLLVSAFAGKEKISQAYNHAKQEKYRFYSYGDGMLIL